ncbi:MAG: transcription termination/antitermination protein NusG [Armatimonadota bacterium]|jgi:transcriptional antiterminator NusG|nr:MAG: transcription termination/antitermination protein NusG [Armatimonadota bacterium]
MEKHWYAVHTYAGHENKVKTSIERRAESLNLKDKISRILVPTEPELRTRGGKRTEVQRKIFPGYVLIEMVLDETTWHLVKSTAGVTGFVSSGNKPVPMQDREIEGILQAVDGPKQPPRVKWAVGDVVRVVSGPFAEFTGKIEDVNVPKETVKVLISIFGRDTPVELEFSQIERL